MKKFKDFFEKHAVWFVVAISIIASISATAYYFHHHDILAYSDARSHLDIARRVIDNKTPGIAQFGGTWLPLPQILMLPFVASYTLWHNGLAGSLVSMAAYVIAAVFIFKIIRLLCKSSFAGLSGSLLFLFSPNILYMQSTPMTELLLMATMLFGSYFFIKWLYGKHTQDLIVAAFGVFLSTLVRYEGWFIVVTCALIILVNSVIFTKKRKTGEGQAILFTTLAGLGIFLWVLWNLVIWGNPLYFLDGDTSAKAQQDQLAAIGQLPTRHHPIASLTTMGHAIYLNIGVWSAVIALIAVVIVLFR